MATRGTEIFGLEQKIRIIAEVLHKLGRLKSPSRREFATSAGIDYDRLKAAWRGERLSTNLENQIAKTAEFDVSDPTWIDSDISLTARSASNGRSCARRDMPDNFRDMLRRRHSLVENVQIVADHPKLLDSNLLIFSVAGSGQGSVIDRPAPLFFSIVVEPGYSPPGLIYGFRRVRPRLILREETPIRIKDRLGAGSPVEIGGALLSVRGDEHHSEWHLSNDTTMLRGDFVTTDNPFCSLVKFAIDDEFEAEVSVRPLDGALVGPDGTELSNKAKQRVIELLQSKKLQAAYDSQGWISLGLQRLRIARILNDVSRAD